MSNDWADEIAYAMTMAWYEKGGTEFEVNEADIAAALRKARQDALEEAEKLAQSKWEDTGDHIAAEIRALKNKP